MRVLMIDNSPHMGGSIHSAGRLLKGLADLGVQMGLFASRPDHFEKLIGPDVKLFQCPWEGFRDVFSPAHRLSGGLPVIGQAVALRRFSRSLVPFVKQAIRDFQPDLVHVNNLNLPNLPVVVAVRDMDRRIVLHARMIREFSHREMESADRAKRIICVSEAVRRCLQEVHPLPPQKLVVIPNAVDVSSFNAPPDSGVREALDLAPDVPLACLLGRLATWKGQHVAISAWKKVIAAIPNAVLALIGAGDSSYADHCRQLAEKLELHAAVRFLGHRDDVPRLLAASDLLVHASCFESPRQGTVEAFGRVIIEAMAAGRPVVATAAGGVPDLVHDGETGFLAAPNDPDDLAVKIIAAFQDQDWRRRAGNQAREAVRDRFNREKVTQQVFDLYQLVLAKQRPE